ncbi:MAG: hypothetical protein O2840_00940 [bacterium]|nr:hypothetical protein [bacterium]
MGWRIGLFALSILAPRVIPYDPSFPYAYDLLAKLGLPQWMYSWANFDGVHYLTIMEKGYIGTGLIQAFFPLFPLFIQFVSFGFSHTIVSLLLNFIALTFALYFFYALVKQRASSKVSWFSLALLLLFPTSFYFGAVYSEAFFLCFVLGAFLAAEKKHWPLATLATGLAISTRLVGVFVFLALIWQLLSPTQSRHLIAAVRKKLPIIALLSLSLAGLVAFMSFLQYEFSDPLYFFHVQSEFGSGRQESLILLPQTLWRGVKILATVPISRIWLTYAQELLLTVLAFTTLAYGYWKRQQLKVPTSWLIFTLGVLVLPTLTGTLSSMPRYILVAFPLFYIWSQLLLKNTLARVILILLSVSLLIYNALLFIQGYWVA